MDFEEWWDNVHSDLMTERQLAKEAFQVGYSNGYSVSFNEAEEVYEAGYIEGRRQGFREGIADTQEEITELRDYLECGMSADARMVADAHAFMKEFEICSECRSVYGKHKMDCGRQR